MTTVDGSTKLRIARSAPLRGPVPPPRRPRETRPVAVPAPPTRPVAVPAPEPTRAEHPRTRVLARGNAAPSAAPRAGRSPFGLLVGALTAGLATGATIASLGVALPGSASAPVTTDLVSAVRQIGPVARSSPVTQTFTFEGGSNFPGFGDPITYRAVGTAVATVDLGSVTAADVRLQGTLATVRIPAAQVGTPTLDRSLSHVVSNDPGLGTSLFGLGASESDIESAAQSHLQTRATDLGLPAIAEHGAAVDIRAVLHRLGVVAVTVTVVQGGS